MDEVIKTLNNTPDHNYVIKYSTVGEYIRAVKSELKSKNIKLEKFTGDFYPVYETWKDVHWTGYFSGRPNFKKYIRDFSSFSYSSSSLMGLSYFRSNPKLEDIIGKINQT